MWYSSPLLRWMVMSVDGVGGFDVGEGLRPVPRAGHDVPQPLGQRAEDEGDVVARVAGSHVAGELVPADGADGAVDGLGRVRLADGNRFQPCAQVADEAGKVVAEAAGGVIVIDGAIDAGQRRR